MSLTLGTRDETEVPLSWLSDLSEPVQVTVRDDVGKSRKLSLITNLTEPTEWVSNQITQNSLKDQSNLIKPPLVSNQSDPSELIKGTIKSHKAHWVCNQSNHSELPKGPIKSHKTPPLMSNQSDHSELFKRPIKSHKTLLVSYQSKHSEHAKGSIKALAVWKIKRWCVCVPKVYYNRVW